ncbi:hypothetical protein DAETH_48250 (plasmid) [Deinococcus aetherius]|uniref:2'-5' RNA ligase n=1 Tax=Deinococcus aetherius TaxID=200252 RepID=A0ABM8AM00_9DEIO|nr:DUF935 family protein [Deinococcus aetherius]BDP44856.1 hypothetical protein DAETH_48250 [Deinococcus aetherius]
MAKVKIERTVHAEPSERVFTEWNPDLVRGAFRRAETGSMRLAADLCDTVLADDRVTGALGSRVKGLLGLGFGFEPAEGAARRTPIIKASEHDWWKANPESELDQVLRWGIFFGLGPGQLVWTQDRQTGRMLPVLKFWHPRHLRFDPVTRGWFINTAEGERSFTPGDGTWVLYAPYGMHRPWAQGVWRACALWWMLKEYARQDWASYSEQHGRPIKVGHAPDTASKEARKALAADLSDLGSDTAIALPPGYDLKLVEASANTWGTFKAQIDSANMGMAIAVAGQNLTSQVTAGSHSAASVHNDIRLDLIESDGESLSTTLHEQQWSWWTEFNFGERRLAPWPKWDTTPPEDLKELATTLNTAGDALKKLDALGVDVDPLLERFKLTRRPEAAPKPGVQARVHQLAARPSKVPDGVLACLVPDPEVAQALAQEGGEAWGELHLTLAFFGKVDDLDPTALRGLQGELRTAAENRDDPVTAVIGGLGRFSLPEKDAFHATVDAPALLALREDVLDRAREHGLEASSLHGFTPHITLAYLDGDAPNPLHRLTPIDTVFTELQLWVGADRYAFSFGQETHRGRLPPPEEDP